jgi:DNA repair exonuclease SbcCD ATPase subunit
MVAMDKETRELLAKLFTAQLEQLAQEKEIDCGESPDRIDYLSILGKSDEITREDVERFIGEMDAKTSETVEGEEYFGEVEKTLKDFKNQGSIFEEANELLEKMQRNFGDGNLEDAIAKGVEGSSLIEDTTIKYELVRRAYVILAFRQLLSDVKEAGIDIGDANTQAQNAAELFHKGETEELDGVLQEIAKKAKDLQKEQAKKLKQLISSVEELIDQTKELGAESMEARDLLQKAEESFESKIFKKVSYYATKAKKAAEDARKDRIQGISDSLLFVKTILEDTREIGADVSEVESLYSDAKTAFQEERYMDCKSLIKDVEQTALQLQDAQIQKAMKLRKRREPEEEAAADKDVVEVEAEVVTPPPRRPPQGYPRPRNRAYPPPMPPPGRMMPPQGMRKTRCPNCGQSFPVRGGRGPTRIECPFCGMRGMMP